VRAALQYPQKDIDWQREQQIKAQASTPPQRTWVGLTDGEIRALAKPSDDIAIPMTGRMWIFVGDLMNKLKEKNT
jgi:hypothetical protein